MHRDLLKVVLSLGVFLFIVGSITHARGGVLHPTNMAADYLYTIGENYYKQGNYPEALHEFKKVLLVNPGHKGAREYVDFIEAELRIRKKEAPRLPEAITEEEVEEIKPKPPKELEVEGEAEAKEIERLAIEREKAIAKALEKAEKKLMGAEVPEEVPPKEVIPKKKAEVIKEKKIEPERPPYEELRIEAERAGFERYYVQGEGFKVTDFLGLATSIENYEELKRIDDMVLITGQEFEGFEGYTNDSLRNMTNVLFTRSFAGQAILRYKDLPRFKYTYEEKDVLTEYLNKDVNIWRIREYDLLYSFPLFGRKGFLTLNPIYKDINIIDELVSTKFEDIDQYHLNYSIRPLDTLEIFAQQHYETNKNLRSADPSRNKNHYSRLELRRVFPEENFRITSGWYHGETKWMPSDTLQVKDEVYLDVGKDLTQRWRGALKLEYDINELRRVDRNHIKSDVFRLENKLSYNLFGNLDISLGCDYGADLSSLSRFDNVSVYGELEYFKFGFLRWKAGYRRTEYLELDQGLDVVYVKTYLFRF